MLAALVLGARRQQAGGADARAQARRELPALRLIEARSATATEIVTALSVVLTCWPPAPPRARGAQRERRVRRAHARRRRSGRRAWLVGHLEPAAYHAGMPGFRERFPAAKPLIGVIHLPRCPATPARPAWRPSSRTRWPSSRPTASAALDGVLVENENDQPHRVEAGRETIAVMTTVTRELVRAAGSLPVGVEILLNDPEASLAVALAAGGTFIRTDYFADEMRRPEHGPMRIAPEAVLAYRARHRRRARARARRHPGQVRADAHPAHARRIRAPRARGRRGCHRRHGHAHGRATLAGARCGPRGTGRAAVPWSSAAGSSAGNAAPLLAAADGAIVGTSLMQDGRATPEQVTALTAARA